MSKKKQSAKDEKIAKLEEEIRYLRGLVLDLTAKINGGWAPTIQPLPWTQPVVIPNQEPPFTPFTRD